MPTTTSTLGDRLQEDAAALRDSARTHLDSSAESLRDHADNAIRRFGARVQDVDAMVEQARVLANRATDYVRARPLRAIGIAVGIGLVAGFLTRRR